MRTIWLVLAGLAGGAVGAMGFGGGTLLIPILTFLLDVSPRYAAWTNLVVFIPMGAVAIFLHAKNRLISVRQLLLALCFSAVGATLALLFAKGVDESLLRFFFGWTLIVLGISSVISVLYGYYEKK